MCSKITLVLSVQRATTQATLDLRVAIQNARRYKGGIGGYAGGRALWLALTFLTSHIIWWRPPIIVPRYRVGSSCCWRYSWSLFLYWYSQSLSFFLALTSTFDRYYLFHSCLSLWLSFLLFISHDIFLIEKKRYNELNKVISQKFKIANYIIGKGLIAFLNE